MKVFANFFVRNRFIIWYYHAPFPPLQKLEKINIKRNYWVRALIFHTHDICTGLYDYCILSLSDPKYVSYSKVRQIRFKFIEIIINKFLPYFCVIHKIELKKEHAAKLVKHFIRYLWTKVSFILGKKN